MIDPKNKDCADCTHSVDTDPTNPDKWNSRYCQAPQLANVLDDHFKPQNTLIVCDAARDFKTACGHQAVWFIAKG